MMTESRRKKYEVSVPKNDTKCLLLVGQETWQDDDFTSEPKSISEIIINSANYYASQNGGTPTGDLTWSYFDRVLWVEPRHPNPNLSDQEK
jgi:hypothetical protein